MHPTVSLFQSQWIARLMHHRLHPTPQSAVLLKDAERKYTFAWRRVRHKMVFGARAFQTR